MCFQANPSLILSVSNANALVDDDAVLTHSKPRIQSDLEERRRLENKKKEKKENGIIDPVGNVLTLYYILLPLY